MGEKKRRLASGSITSESRLRKTAKSLNVVFHPPSFEAYEPPLGFLPKGNRAAHALFYYALTASRVYEDNVKDPIVYEGDPDPEYDFRNLFMSVAQAYMVRPEEMVNHWLAVEMTFKTNKIALTLPDEEKYRFNTKPEIVTETKQ